MRTKLFFALALMLFVFLWAAGPAVAAPKARILPHWLTNNPKSRIKVDHGLWNIFLKKYVVVHPSGINRVRYKLVTANDREKLNQYLADLQKIKVTRLKRAEQKAYWINLYNALTVKVILDHYPVKSIRDIDISPGFFSDGPWDKKLVNIEGAGLSLDEIEHRILRPVWHDNRIHYALNCASLGCPNLQPEAFTAANTEELLNKGAREYINSKRGMEFKGGNLNLSSIYDWFRDDFGGSKSGVLKHLEKYADPKSVQKLQNFKGKITYRYDWNLNE